MSKRFPEYAPRPPGGDAYPLTHQAEQRSARGPRDSFRPYLAASLAVALVIAAVGVAVVLHDQPAARAADKAAVPSAQPGPAVPARKPTEYAPPVRESMVADGIYLVGKEIKSGTYRTVSTPDCFWARLRDTSREDGAIITSGHLIGGQQYVTIARGDRAFETRGCSVWVMVR